MLHPYAEETDPDKNMLSRVLTDYSRASRILLSIIDDGIRRLAADIRPQKVSAQTLPLPAAQELTLHRAAELFLLLPLRLGR